jgi:hypothetical protein
MNNASAKKLETVRVERRALGETVCREKEAIALCKGGLQMLGRAGSRIGRHAAGGPCMQEPFNIDFLLSLSLSLSLSPSFLLCRFGFASSFSYEPKPLRDLVLHVDLLLCPSLPRLASSRIISRCASHAPSPGAQSGCSRKKPTPSQSKQTRPSDASSAAAPARPSRA